MKNEKNYIASSIKKVTTQYGDLFNANIKLDDLKKIEKKGWVSITIAERESHLRRVLRIMHTKTHMNQKIL